MVFQGHGRLWVRSSQKGRLVPGVDVDELSFGHLLVIHVSEGIVPVPRRHRLPLRLMNDLIRDSGILRRVHARSGVHRAPDPAVECLPRSCGGVAGKVRCPGTPSVGSMLRKSVSVSVMKVTHLVRAGELDEILGVEVARCSNRGLVLSTAGHLPVPVVLEPWDHLPALLLLVNHVKVRVAQGLEVAIVLAKVPFVVIGETRGAAHIFGPWVALPTLPAVALIGEAVGAPSHHAARSLLVPRTTAPNSVRDTFEQPATIDCVPLLVIQDTVQGIGITLPPMSAANRRGGVGIPRIPPRDILKLLGITVRNVDRPRPRRRLYVARL